MRSAAILAGGTARRLGGRPKGGLGVGDRSILARQLDVLRAIGVDHVSVVGRTPLPLVGALHPVADAVDHAGALGGLYTALLVAPAEQVLVIACDMPFLSAAFLEQLFERGADTEAVVPRTADGWHPLAALYHRRIAGRVKARIDRRQLRIIDALDEVILREVGPGEVAEFDPEGVLLLNVNTPIDYERACRHAGAREDDSARM